MPFESSTQFDSDALSLLQSAYDQVCVWLTRDGAEPPSEIRNRIVSSLIESVSAGERDPIRLKAAALDGVGKLLNGT